jgi:hypothetical protein
VTENQSTLDDYVVSVATAARDTGQDRATAGDSVWFDRALRWIREQPAGSRFDADDIRLALGRSSAAGGVFATARRRGWIVTVDVGISRSVTRRRGLQRLWVRI